MLYQPGLEVMTHKVTIVPWYRVVVWYCGTIWYIWYSMTPQYHGVVWCGTAMIWYTWYSMVYLVPAWTGGNPVQLTS